MTTTLHHGDALDVLKTLPGNSVGALCCDPPAGIGFMNKAFDSDRGGRQHWIAWLSAIMAEALRVAKPGAHGFVWALPRTSHWTATALEDAGWEIRDICTHLFGSGFPKSKALGNGQGTALKPANEHWVLIRKPIDAPNIAANVARHGVGALDIAGCRVGTGETLPERKAGYNDSPIYGGGAADFVYKPDSAGRWPPNAIFTHHPDCRPVGTRRVRGATGVRGKGGQVYGGGKGYTADFAELGQVVGYADADGLETVAAWSCVAGCPILEIDRQSGERKAGVAVRHRSGGNTFGGTNPKPPLPDMTYDDTGGASRFFPTFAFEADDFAPFLYQSKAPARERLRVDGVGHPTQKSLALMIWLVKLVTPPGETCLDPFLGSGTTGCAAVALGRDFVGIEQDSSYLEISRLRIAHAERERDARPRRLPLFQGVAD